MEGPLLHRCLLRGDFMAFFAELEKTQDLFARDRGGRTALDLALQLALELFQSCFSSSRPVDHSGLVQWSPCCCAACARRRHRSAGPLEGESSSKSPFKGDYNIKSPFKGDFNFKNPLQVENKSKNPLRVHYNEQYFNLYAQPRQMRLQAAVKPPVPSLPPPCKFAPVEFPPGWSSGASWPAARPGGLGGPVDHSQAEFPLPSGAAGPAPSGAAPQQFFYPCEAAAGSLEGSRQQQLQQQQEQLQQQLENKMLQREVLVLVEEVFAGPLCELLRARLQRLLRKLRALLLVLKRLGCCSLLRIKATEMAVESGLLQQKITYPFLYTALLHRAFKQHPCGPNGQPFDPLNPADGRRMVQLLVNYQMPGFELVLFLGNLTALFSDFVAFFAQDDVRVWRPSREVQQYYLHMAFALDSADLFQFIINYGQLLFVGNADVFKWEDLLYVLMEHRDKFRPYFAPLLASRLKSRVQKRLVEEGPAKEIRKKFPPEPVKYPCEERLLTQKVLSEFGSLFGKEEAQELSELLSRWKYGAARPQAEAAGFSRSSKLQ
ncbi:hypothetical protein, conserved [Eimeria necatrix]|uniref:Uncharacterized protein n=1 Tax=Eimeria necatrix TaxID=51315 RepID=U6MSU3_9EIME|nr:hypothetical protein, conserved [Eimeria necatrix]CDJ67287.1 hypothetical protein, conserved [Eimeria necatrix]